MSQKDERYKKNKREFLEIVLKPSELEKVCNENVSHRNENSTKPTDYIDYWVNELRGNTPLMVRIIATYMDKRVEAGFILSQSIRYIKGKSSKFFEDIYTTLCKLKDESGFRGGWIPERARELIMSSEPYADFKRETLRYLHEKTAAIGRVKNQSFLTRIVDEVPDDCGFMFHSHYTDAVTNITNQKYLARVATTKKDSYMVEAAIRRLTDKKVLKRFVSMTDEQVDAPYTEGRSGSLYPSGSPQQSEAFHNSFYRRAARERLQQLAR